MRLQWKEVPNESNIRGQWAALYVTLNPKGRFFLTRVTHERMGSPKAYIVLFDANNSIVGLKPAQPNARNARHACPINKSGCIAVHAYRFIQDHNIRLPMTIRFVDPEI